jgi:hypothetical protein
MSFDWNAYRSALPANEAAWEDAEDLGRLSVSAFLSEQAPLRREVSSGIVRLTGSGVSGHSAPVEHVANVMRNFQRLVLASGLSLSGFKTLRGRLPSDVVSKTLLHLDGSALAGSLVLTVVPATLPEQEISPDGQAEFFRDNEKQLVDQAVERSVDLLNLSKSIGPSADDSVFLSEVLEAGPRVASTIRDLADSLIQGGFGTELTWNEPGQRRLVARLNVSELSNLSSLVGSRELGREPTVLTGIARTVSDIAPLRVEIADDQIESIQADEISHEVIAALRVGMMLRIHASVTEDISAGGEVTTHYRATSIEILNELGDAF